MSFHKFVCATPTVLHATPQREATHNYFRTSAPGLTSDTEPLHQVLLLTLNHCTRSHFWNWTIAPGLTSDTEPLHQAFWHWTTAPGLTSDTAPLHQALLLAGQDAQPAAPLHAGQVLLSLFHVGVDLVHALLDTVQLLCRGGRWLAMTRGGYRYCGGFHYRTVHNLFLVSLSLSCVFIYILCLYIYLVSLSLSCVMDFLIVDYVRCTTDLYSHAKKVAIESPASQ